MVRLIRRDLHANSPMGGSQRAGAHELARPTGRNQIYSAGSPVPHGQRAVPRLLPRKVAARRNRSLKDRMRPLIDARSEANDIYNSTYFENHYPVADKDLKHALNEKIMNAHSRLNAEDNGEDEADAQGITIVLNIGK